MLRYHQYTESEPTLDSYRLSHEPRAGYGMVFLCPFAVVTGESGNMYQLMRGYQGRSKGTVLNYGIYQLDDELDHQVDHLYPYSVVPVDEPFRCVDRGDAVAYVSDHSELVFGVSDYSWYDASGKVELHGERLGPVGTWWVPTQDGIDVPQMLRSHMAKVTGAVGDDPVEGLFMADLIYSRPDVMWNEMGMLTKVHNVWLNWLVEYTDGTYEGGYAWRGRPGSGFAAAFHVVDGEGTGRTDAELILDHTERGSVSGVTLRLGGEVTVELEQDGSTDWPLHTCGRAVRTSRDKEIARSWNYTEYFPLNWGDIYDYMTAYEKLYGRPASFRRLMDGAIVNSEQLLVYPR
jgi:hypothetical protein